MTPHDEHRSGSGSLASVTDISFQVPDHLVRSAWTEHVPFAFWLIEAHRPRRLVELGTHNGLSYFAFCQAVDVLGLGTRCWAVDTWVGDEHAGFYSEEVFELVSRVNRSRYAGFSHLVRSTFDQASDQFEDGSVDLLHIDGRHFYEDVRHDFETWFPKLSDRGIVLFHDTNVRERGFGVHRLWAEVRFEHVGSVEFLHGHGLGVLQVGPNVDTALAHWFQDHQHAEHLSSLRERYARLGRGVRDRFEAEERGRELKELKRRLARVERRAAESQQALAAVTRRADAEEARAERLRQRLDRLRSRRVVRAALALSGLFRPAIRVARLVGGLGGARDRRPWRNADDGGGNVVGRSDPPARPDSAGPLRTVTSSGADDIRGLPPVGLLVPGGADPRSWRATAHIRVDRRYQHPTMRRRMQASYLDHPEAVADADLDAVIVLRDGATGRSLESLLSTVGQRGCRLVFDLDDALTEKGLLPEGSPWHDTVDDLRRLATGADHVTVSTPRLAELITEKYNPSVQVVPNALDERLWFSPEPVVEPEPDRPLRILYFGTFTHAGDLALLEGVLGGLRSRTGRDVRLEVVGVEPRRESTAWYDRRSVPRPCKPYPEFVHWLRRQQHRWDVGVAPLVPGGINDFKSDLKFLEISALGLPTAASRVPAYHDTIVHGENGVLVDNDVESWTSALLDLLLDTEAAARLAQRARSYVATQRTVERQPPDVGALLGRGDDRALVRSAR